jgi:hypothetical protein
MKNMFDSRGPRWRGLGLTAALLVALFLPACSDDSTTIPDVPRAIILVTVEPNPVIGVQNGLTGSVSAAYVVQLRELAGLGATISFISSTTFDPETGLQVATSYFDSADLKVFVGSDRLEPNGELDIPQTSTYSLPDFRVNADLTVYVQAVDDQGTLINQSILVRIIPPPEE